MIQVTQTFLPSMKEYQQQLTRAWEIGWITNRGILVEELEAKLKERLNVSHMIAMTNGTLPLQIAIKGLGLSGEIITAPFSYVATTSAIVWEQCTPVFVDIHPEYLTIDEEKIEAAITSSTSAILATHVFGNPCAIEKISEIADRYDLKVIYDAAHCFGVDYKGKSLFTAGDVSTCSFHATKLFHTGEGGALFCDASLFDTFYYHHNFGHNGPVDFHGLGINAKMSEMQAAMGLSVLPHMETILRHRKQVVEWYDEQLESLSLQRLRVREHTNWNYSYYPVIFSSEVTLLKVQEALKQKEIFPRRYFYPSLHNLPYVDAGDCPISASIAKRILCLPLSHATSENEVDLISSIIKSVLL